MKYVLILLLCFWQTQLNAQHLSQQQYRYSKDTIYEDENGNSIDKRLFNYKFDSSIYHGYKFEEDKNVLLKLRLSYLFGELESTKKVQLFKLLASRNNIDTTKIMVIHYEDTLKRIVDFPKEDSMVFNKDRTQHTHIHTHKSFIFHIKQCIRNFKRNKKSNVYHFFGVNKGHPLIYEKCELYEDNFGLINNMFRDQYKRFKTIIVHPSGKFYCINYSDGRKSIDIYKDIIKDKKWDEHMSEFSKSIKSLNSL